MALEEANLITQLESPYIICLREYFSIDTNLFIVMDYAADGTLQEIINKQYEKGEYDLENSRYNKVFFEE